MFDSCDEVLTYFQSHGLDQREFGGRVAPSRLPVLATDLDPGDSIDVGFDRGRDDSDLVIGPRTNRLREQFNQIVRTVVVGGDRLLALSYDGITELELSSLAELNWIPLS